MRIIIQGDVYEYEGTLTVTQALETIQSDFVINEGFIFDELDHELLPEQFLNAGHGLLRYDENRDSALSVGSIVVSVHDTVRFFAWNCVIRFWTWLRHKYAAATTNVKRLIDWLVLESFLIFLCAIVWFASATFGVFGNSFVSAVLNLVSAFLAVVGATEFWVIVCLFIKAVSGPVRVAPAPN